MSEKKHLTLMSLYTDFYVTKYLLEGMDCKRRELSKKFYELAWIILKDERDKFCKSACSHDKFLKMFTMQTVLMLMCI